MIECFRVGVLGPVQLACDGRPVVLGSAKVRQLLAILVLSANRVVSPGRLVEVLWDMRPPPSAEKNLHTYVHRLRQALRFAGLTGRLVRVPAGYQLSLTAAECDLLEFRRIAAEARAAGLEGADQRSADLFGRALDCWRADALADVAGISPLLAGEASKLEAERQDVVEKRASALLASGRPDLALPLLRDQVSASPLREGAVTQLVGTLELLGRRAEALELCRATESRFAAVLGVEPGAEFRRLHRRLLDGRTAQDVRHPARPGGGGGGPSRQPDLSPAPYAGVPAEYRAASAGSDAEDRSRSAARDHRASPMPVLDLQKLSPELTHLSSLVISCTSCTSNSCNTRS